MDQVRSRKVEQSIIDHCGDSRSLPDVDFHSATMINESSVARIVVQIPIRLDSARNSMAREANTLAVALAVTSVSLFEVSRLTFGGRASLEIQSGACGVTLLMSGAVNVRCEGSLLFYESANPIHCDPGTW